MLRYMHAPRGEGPLAHRRDDPARLLHDEAQRHHRDDAGDLAGVRAACIPFAPARSGAGLRRAVPAARGRALAEITGFARCRCSRTPARRASTPACWSSAPTTASRGDAHRTVCLIPTSRARHQSGERRDGGHEGRRRWRPMRTGNIDLADLQAKAAQHAAEARRADGDVSVDARRVRSGHQGDLRRSSTQHGGQVYMDGANMNAQVGLCRPGDIGADVCHLNLHKTFCIPHGGGGPGMGPIGVAAASGAVPARRTRWCERRSRAGCGTVSAAPWGSASILPISCVYIAADGRRGAGRGHQDRDPQSPTTSRSGSRGTTRCSTPARTGWWRTSASSTCARSRRRAGIEVEDIAKRLIDYGFHAPTVSFPVPGTLMIEPTESRVEGGARPLLRRDDRDPRGDPRGREPASPIATTTC